MPVEENLMQAILLTFGTAMVPVLELRGAIPVGVAAGLSPAAACLVSILGNMVPVPFILLLIRRIFDWLRGTRLFGPRIDWLERRAHLKGRIVKKYRTIGLIIPPSILFVVYGSITGASITKLFMGGIIPGLIMGAFLIVACFYKNRKVAFATVEKASWGERWNALKDAFWGLMMPVIILGGIYGGIFTPTEAAAVSAVYGLLVAIFVYHSITWKVFMEIMTESVKQTASVMFITAAASLFAWVITVKGYAAAATNFLIEVSGGNLVVLLIIINIILLIAGCFLDGTSACYIFVPIIAAAATQLGYDPIALGVVCVMNLAIGNATPPVGVCLYVACGLAKISLKEISKHAAPYILASVLALLLITYVPQIALFLPNMIKQ